LRQLHHQFEITDRSDRFSGKKPEASGGEKSVKLATKSARSQRNRSKRLPIALGKHAIALVALGMSSAIAIQCDSLWNSSASRAFAQLIPDSTLGAERSQVTPGLIQQISGGATRDTNLFHSFQQFSIPTGGAALFLNAPQIQNIISRVTGLSPSQIDGLIQTQGTASLYLINPNGIIFGGNAQLNIGGSFIGTTANALAFPDGNIFSASAPNIPSQTLTVNPSAFLFNQLANQPTPRIEVQPGAVLTVGAARNPASLFLVGGNVLVNGGKLQGRAGSRVEVAGFTGSGSVNFTVDGNILDLVFPFNGVVGADVTLTNGAVVNVGTRAEDADGIVLVGGTVSLTNGSQLSTSTFGTGDAGIIFLQADNILIDTSSLFSTAVAQASGDAGGILLNADSISIRNAKLDTANSGSGVAGDMILNGRNSVSIDDSEITSASANNLPDGTTPDLSSISSIRIAASEGSVVFDNSSITTTNSGSGIAGYISITARDRVSIANSFSLDDNNRKGIFSQGNQGRIFIGTSGTDASVTPQTVTIDRSILSSDNISSTGAGDINAGGISLQARDSVFLTNQTQLSSNTYRQGSAGDVFIKTNDGLVSLDNRSVIFTTVESGGVGNGGNIALDTGSLSLSNGSQLQTLVRGSTTLSDGSVRPAGRGNAGVVFVKATDSISLSDPGTAILSTLQPGAFSPNTVSNTFAGNIFDVLFGGNDPVIGSILIATNGSLSLENGAQLNSSSLGNGNAGGVLVLAGDKVSLSEGSKIASGVGQGAVGNSGAILIGANSVSVADSGITTSTFGDGFAGLVAVGTKEEISVTGSNSGIFSIARSTSPNAAAGAIGINARSLYVQDGGQISVDNQTLGVAGGISVTASEDLFVLNGSKLTATTTSGEGGDIELRLGGFLVLLDNSNIDTTAIGSSGGGNGGKITIAAPYIFGVPVNDNNIRSNAGNGNGGAIRIRTNRLYSIDRRFDVLQTNDISARALNPSVGINGIEEVNTLNVDPTQGVTNLPTVPVDTSRLIAQQCAARSRESGQENKFVVTGRGGLPTNPNNPLHNESVVTDWVGEPPQDNPSENNNSANPDRSFSTATNSAKPSALVEAQGWAIGEKGEIILTANAPTVIPHDLKLTPDASCNGS
jgi:filamentous hemagglutinin family protein